MVLANTIGGAQTSKGIISQVLAKEHHWVYAAGGDATACYAKSALKGKKKGKRCCCCKNKGHVTSECHKREQEETTSPKASSGKTLGKSQSRKSLSGKSSSRGSSSKPQSSRTTDSAKIVTTNSNSSSNSDSDNTVQVFMAHTSPDEDIEHVYKTRARLHQSNL